MASRKRGQRTAHIFPVRFSAYRRLAMPPISHLMRRPTNEDGTPKEWARSEPLSTLHPVIDHAMPTPVEAPYRPTPGLRCPLPPVGAQYPDNIRQLHQPGVSTARMITPKVAS